MISNEEKMLKDRIRHLLNVKGAKITHLAEQKSERVMLGRQFADNDTIVPYRTLYKLLYMFDDISADWLLMGEGSMYKADCLAPRVYNTKNEVRDSKAGGDILVGTTTIPCSVESILNEKDRTIEDLRKDKAILQEVISKFISNK